MTYVLPERAGSRSSWRCPDCGIYGRTHKEQLEHCLSLRHHYALEERSRREMSHYCSLCRTFCSSLPQYVDHINGRAHLDAMRQEGLSSYRPSSREDSHSRSRTGNSQDQYEQEGTNSQRSPRDSNSSFSHLQDHEYTSLSLGSSRNHRSMSVKDESRQDDHRHPRSKSWEHTRKNSDHKRQTDSDHSSSATSKPSGRDDRNGKSDPGLDSTIGTSAEKQCVDRIPSSEKDNAAAGKATTSVSSTRDKGDDKSSHTTKEPSSVPSLPEYLSLEVNDTSAKYNPVPEEKRENLKKEDNEIQGQSRAKIQTGSSGQQPSEDNSGDVIVLGDSHSPGHGTKQSQMGNGKSEKGESTSSTALKDLVSSSSVVQLKKLSPSVVQKVLRQTQSGKTNGSGNKTSVSSSSPTKPVQTSTSEKSSEKSDVSSSIQQDLSEKRERLLEACKRIDKEAVDIREKKQAREAARWLDQQSVRTEQWDRSQQEHGKGVLSDKNAAEIPPLSGPSMEGQTLAKDDTSDGSVAPPAMADAMNRLCGMSGLAQKSASRPQCKYVLEDGKQCGVITFSQYCPHHKQVVQSQTGDQHDLADKAMEVDESEEINNQNISSGSCATPSQTHGEHSNSLVWDDSQPRDARSSVSLTPVKNKNTKHKNRRSVAHGSGSQTGQFTAASSQVVQQMKKRKNETTPNANSQKRPRMSASGAKSQGLHRSSESTSHDVGDKHKQGKKRRSRWHRRQNSRVKQRRAAIEAKKLENELSLLRAERAKTTKEVKELHARLDQIYQDMRLKLRRETQIVTRLMQISGQREAWAMNASDTFQEQASPRMQENQQRRPSHGSHSSLTVVRSSLSFGSGSSNLGSGGLLILDSTQTPTPANAVSNVAAPHRIVTVGSGAPSSHSFLVPVARKSCNPRPASSTDVRQNVVSQSSHSHSVVSSRRQSDQRPTSASTPASTRSKVQSAVSSTKKTVNQSVSPVILTSTPVSSSSKKQLSPVLATSTNQKASPLPARSSAEDQTSETGAVTKQDGNPKTTVSVPSTAQTHSSSLGSGILIKPDPDGPSETLPPLHMPSGELTPGPFCGHTKSVSCLKVGGGLLFSCSTDKSCCIFNTKTHKLVRRFTEHSAAVTSVQLVLTACKYRLFTGSRDQTVRSFDLQRPTNKSCTHNFRFSSQVTALHSDWGLLFVGLESGNVCCLDVKANKLAVRYDCHSPKEVICLASGSEGTQRLLLSCSSDTTIGVRHAESGLLVRTLTGHQQPVLCMTVHSNLVFSGGQDKTVHVHNYHTGKIIHVIHGHKGFVTGIQFLGDSIITASADQHVRCYNSKTFKLLQVCSYDSEPIYAIAVSPSNMVYTGGLNGGVTAIRVDLSKNYVCKWSGCGMIFGGENGLLRHVTEVHRGSSVTFQCQWSGCTKVFRSWQPKSVFADHVKLHMIEAATSSL